jgi:hypothetical protein
MNLKRFENMPSIIIFPGRNKPWRDGIGDFLYSKGYNPTGINLTQDFMQTKLSDQLKNISNLLFNSWKSNTILIGKSYGAYLLLHSLLDLPSFPGRIVLFSPVLGKAFVEHHGQFFCSIPPRSKKFLRIIQEKAFPNPAHLEVHTGSHDKGCDPRLAKEFSESIPCTSLHIIPNKGHKLDHSYENKILIERIESIAEE